MNTRTKSLESLRDSRLFYLKNIQQGGNFMIIDQSTALLYMKNDIEYFYYDLVDMKYRPESLTVFALSADQYQKHDYVLVSINEDEILIDVHSECIPLIDKAIAFARQKGIAAIFLSAEKDTDMSAICSTFSLIISDNQSNKHWGIFGAIDSAAVIQTNPDIAVSKPSPQDIAFIADLPGKEWAFLPNRIRFLNNILIAKKGTDLLGYLVYDSAEPGHYDILMIYVHPNSRRLGAASALIKGYAAECAALGGIPYYVCANSQESAELARALHIPEIRQETVIYKFQ